jgi:hypothetical protein
VLSHIHSKAKTAGPAIYALAEISPPKEPSPIAPPGTPYRFEFELSQIGEMKLTWKCKNPKGAEGTIYQIYRQIGMSGELVYVGFTGKKKLIDMTLPRGVAMVVYQIRGVRGTTVGPWAQFNVIIGTGRTTPVQAPFVSKLCA